MNSVEIERKYIIAMPDLELISRLGGYERTEIIQTYLEGEPCETRRVRKRSYPDRTVYTETSKRRIGPISAIEREREISEEEYTELIKAIKHGTRPIKKCRHSFLYGKVTVEIDVYPEWQRSCIMETELESADDTPELPPFIEILHEVSGEHKYSNAAMAHSFPEEII